MELSSVINTGLYMLGEREMRERVEPKQYLNMNKI